MLLIQNDATFTEANMEKEKLKNKKEFDAGGKTDACGDDKLMFILTGALVFDRKIS